MFLIILCVTSVLMGASTAEKPSYDLGKARNLFEDFVKTHGKVYSNQVEKQRRFEIFKENVKKINQMNSVGDAVFAINTLSDLTKEEVERQYMGFKPSLGDGSCKVITDSDITTNNAPASFNWATQGAVTPIKNQLSCGSCWAFSTIGNIEGQYYMKNKQLKSFSEQQLVDCSIGNMGCEGGIMKTAMSDMQQLGGIELESTYPYVGKEQKCNFDKSKVAVTLAGCTIYQLQDEEKLKEVLVNTGPIAIAVNGTNMVPYTGGILTKANCKSKAVNHAVLLVGYGNEGGVDYWIIKNSWGAGWGENGYIRIYRGDNTCGLMNDDITSANL